MVLCCFQLCRQPLPPSLEPLQPPLVELIAGAEPGHEGQTQDEGPLVKSAVVSHDRFQVRRPSVIIEEGVGNGSKYCEKKLCVLKITLLWVFSRIALVRFFTCPVTATPPAKCEILAFKT